MVTQTLTKPPRHYLQFTDLSAEEYAQLFKRASFIKAKFKAYEKYQPLTDRTLAMIFEKASTRTRVSFEAGMYQMGGSVVHLTMATVNWVVQSPSKTAPESSVAWSIWS